MFDLESASKQNINVATVGVFRSMCWDNWRSSILFPKLWVATMTKTIYGWLAGCAITTKGCKPMGKIRSQSAKPGCLILEVKSGLNILPGVMMGSLSSVSRPVVGLRLQRYNSIIPTLFLSDERGYLSVGIPLWTVDWKNSDRLSPARAGKGYINARELRVFTRQKTSQ